MGTTGLQSNINDTATVSIGMSNGPPNRPPEPTVFGGGFVQELDLYNNGTLYSSVVAMLTDGEGYVVLNPEDYWGGEYRIFYNVRSCCRGVCKSSRVRTQCQ